MCRHLATAGIACLLLALCSIPARAYLIDANDARTVDPGTVEFELQPVGYLQTFGIEGERYLVAPSLMLYVGLADRVDMIFLARGYAGLDDSSYAIDDATVLIRNALRVGHYADEEREGIDVVLQYGLYTPTYQGDSDWGASFALLVSHAGDLATLHANAQVDLRARFSTFAIFSSVVVEPFPDSVARPTFELFADLEFGPGDVELDLSAMLGAVLDVGDSLQFGAGVRAGDLVGDRELEVRLTMWGAFDFRRAPTRPARPDPARLADRP